MPRLADDVLAEWRLAPSGEVRAGRASLVVPVRGPDGEAVLKLAKKAGELDVGVLALRSLDDALTVLASRHAGPRLTPAIGLFVMDDTAVLTARSGRSPVRWALRSADREIVRGPRLPPLSPEDLHRTLAGNPAVREVPIREVRALWGRTDLTHVEWLVEVATVLGLPGSRVLDGADDSLGPVISPDESAVRAFESVVKDVHQ